MLPYSASMIVGGFTDGEETLYEDLAFHSIEDAVQHAEDLAYEQMGEISYVAAQYNQDSFGYSGVSEPIDIIVKCPIDGNLTVTKEVLTQKDVDHSLQLWLDSKGAWEHFQDQIKYLPESDVYIEIRDEFNELFHEWQTDIAGSNSSLTDDITPLVLEGSDLYSKLQALLQDETS